MGYWFANRLDLAPRGLGASGRGPSPMPFPRVPPLLLRNATGRREAAVGPIEVHGSAHPTRSRNCGFLSAPKALTLAAYLGSNCPCYYVCYYRPIPILALMPMSYYIFPTPLSEPKARRGDATPAPASLLHLRGLLHCPVRPRPRPSGFNSDTETPLS
jgi:hypothetical protein